MIQLLAIDMDGTCLNDHHRISDRTLQALRQAAEAGIQVVPTTGRTTTCIPRQLYPETFYHYIISSNGADVAELATQKSLYRAQIPWQTTVELLRQCRQAHLGLSVHVNHQFVVEGAALNLLGRLSYGKDARHTVYAHDIASDLERDRADVEEIQLFFFSKAARARAEQLLSGRTDLIAAWSGCYVELYAPEASKGHALAALGAHLGIPQSDIACIGDAENDLSMFEASGLRFAMGNGTDAVKAAADVVLPTNNENGVAHAITDYLLKQTD